MSSRLFPVLLKLAVAPVLIFWTGCASEQRPVPLDPVGPTFGGPAGSGGAGRLVVYSASHEMLAADGVMTYPHDDYKIYNERKSCIKRVRNQSGANGEAPAVVDLASGRYNVIARSEMQGLVSVPVIIEAGLATEVKLEHPHRRVTVNAVATD